MANNIVAIYAGRFHPFHKGHKAVYDSLAGKFGADKVFIATSGKQNDTDSPFSFKEKAAMMMLTGIPGKAISEEVSPYKPENILKKFSPDTAVVFAVGQKDMDESPRFKPGLKKDGSPTYYQALAGKKVDAARLARRSKGAMARPRRRSPCGSQAAPQLQKSSCRPAQ